MPVQRREKKSTAGQRLKIKNGVFRDGREVVGHQVWTMGKGFTGLNCRVWVGMLVCLGVRGAGGEQEHKEH